MKKILFCVAIVLLVMFSCTPEEQPPTVSYVFSDVSVDAGKTSATITCRNESVDDNKVKAGVLLSKNENITDATKYPLRLQNDTLRGTISGLESNTMYFFCFEVYTANEHKRTDEVHHFQTTGSGDLMVTTSEAINITQTAATGGGNVSAEGNYTVSMRGVCWDTVHNPNVVQSPHLLSGEGMGSYVVNITGLRSGTTYYMRAYAVCNDVTYYGNEVSFTTLSGDAPSVQVPSVTTEEVSNITQTTTQGGGNVTSDGGASVTERGICWGTSHNPTTSGSHADSGMGTGSFTVNMMGLTPNTTYFVRAYASNSEGTSYGAELSFKTSQNYSSPTVTTSQVTTITETTAKGGGNVTSNGGASVTERGICWGTSPNPTINGDHANSGTGGTGTFTIDIVNLTPNTTYYVRAYAVNSLGVGYGNDEVFTTIPEPVIPEGAAKGVFSVSATTQVWFSKGNLQYIGSASPAYWKFAENQWDYFGTSTGQNSGTTTVDRDLFGWATSGYYCGSSCYMPHDVNNSATYGPLYSNLTGEYANADWGVYNAISNGGNAPGMWRTLSSDEWTYVMAQRDTPSKILFAKAVVNGVNGVVLLPDDWVGTNYTLSSINNKTAHYDSNVISEEDWISSLESKGAVFLPAAGMRSGIMVNSGSGGMYWSSTVRYSDTSCAISFSNTSMGQEAIFLGAYAECKKYLGGCVRLVQECR